MDEIKKTVHLSEMKRNIIHRKLFCLAVRKLPVMYFLYVGILLLFILSIYGLNITKKAFGTLSAVSYVDFIVLPIFVAFMVLWIAPLCIYYLDFKRAFKMYGESYVSVSDENGFKAATQIISWNTKKKIINSKYGIAMISFYKVEVLFPVNGFTKEEYKQLKVWMHIS